MDNRFYNHPPSPQISKLIGTHANTRTMNLNHTPNIEIGGGGCTITVASKILSSEEGVLLNSCSDHL